MTPVRHQPETAGSRSAASLINVMGQTGGGPALVIGAPTWEDLARQRSNREVAVLGVEEVYQLTMYAASQGRGGTAAMIYPRHEAATLPEERLDLFDPTHTAPHATLYLRPVPLLELAASLDAGEPGISFRRRLARTLALGSTPEGVTMPNGN